MAKVRKEVELAVRLPETGGGFGEVLHTVAGDAVNVLAFCHYRDPAGSVVLLIADDPVAAKDSIESAGFPCKANAVIVVNAPDQVGAAARIGAHLHQAGIEILYSYASAASAGEFLAVFKTSDDELALSVLAESVVSRAA